VRFRLKVNISYAVELQDVPVEVGKLVAKVGYDTALLLNDIEDIATSNPTEAIDSIAAIRRGLKDLDLRLDDCTNILTGYVDLQNKVSAGTLEGENEVEDEPPV